MRYTKTGKKKRRRKITKKVKEKVVVVKEKVYDKQIHDVTIEDKDGDTFLCKCKCGTDFLARGYHVRNHLVVNCGCAPRKPIKDAIWLALYNRRLCQQFWAMKRTAVALNLVVDEEITILSRFVVKFKDKQDYYLVRIDENKGYTLDNIEWRK